MYRSRVFSSSNSVSSRAVIFTSNGIPAEIIRVISFPQLPSPRPKSLNIRFLLSPIKPSDINVIEGIYPAKPEPRTDLVQGGPGSVEEPCFIVGNEGLAEVKEIGEGVSRLKVGDRVVMLKPQAGTWSTCANVQEKDVIKVPDIGDSRINDAQGATMTVR